MTVVAEPEALAPSRLSDRLLVRVARKAAAADGIVLLELVAPDGSALPHFEAGAHVDVHFPGGLTRQYSLLNAPGQGHHYRLGILLDPATRGGSQAAHRLRPGDMVEIGRPRNSFKLIAEAPFSLLMAGGIGITPLLSMAEDLRASSRAFALHYFVRTRAKAAFLDRLAAANLAPHVEVHCDDEPNRGGSGIEAVLRGAAMGTQLYICGPAGFIAAVADTATRLGWAEDRIHIERFGGEPAPMGGGAFRVDLARTGGSVVVPLDKSIAATLLDHGINVELSCEQGICGTCVTRVLSGIPDHRDQYFTDAERAAGDQMTICCSRALTDSLVLDL